MTTVPGVLDGGSVLTASASLSKNMDGGGYVFINKVVHQVHSKASIERRHHSKAQLRLFSFVFAAGPGLDVMLTEI